ncbi:SpoIIE family protein phosphatase [Streptomyces sp. NPDC001339]|uniref:SpoIIE family protein phosphatase n=1 Tax=Streptomyces sp. NPDC001339 TaxID=3364563 RepID=UPI0036D13925
MAADRAGDPADSPAERPAHASFDVADAAMLLVDARGRVESWPGTAERLLGHPARDTVGRPAADLLTPDDAARLPALAAECRAHGGWYGTLSARRDDGQPVGIQVQVVPVTDHAGREHWLVLTAPAPAAPSAYGWETSRPVLERIVTTSPVGMAVVDTDLRFVWSNHALEQFGGGPADQRLGRRLGEIQPGLDAAALEAQMRRVLHTGEPVTGYEHAGRVVSDPYHERAQMMSFVRLDDPDGRPLGVCYTVIDVTEHYRSRRQMALLDRAGEYIGRTLDVMQTAQDLADVAVPELADCVVVDLLDTVVRGEEPLPGPLSDADTVPLRRGGQQSLREGVPESTIEIGGLAGYHASSPPVRALAGGGSWRAERLDPHAPDWAAEVPGGHRAHFGELGLHTAMVVPIRARGTTMGVATFFRGQGDDAFTEDDLRLAEEFVARAAVCMDNARRYTRERQAALALQRSLLPQSSPAQDAVRVASAYRPANELGDIGGDWFDVIALSGARVALVVGEVTGHGIDAVATMGRLRTAVQTLAALDLRPEEVLAHLDDVVDRLAREEKGRRTDAVALGSSCLYAVYDPIGRTCTMASAGHPAPAVIAPDGTVAFTDLTVGPQLGVGGLPFESSELPVAEGSVLALYTDGLLSGTGAAPGRAGRERLRDALAAPGLTLDALCSHVVDELVSARTLDDAALLLAETCALDTGRYATWDLSADPAVVAEARAVVTGQLERWDLADLAFTTELVVSELVTNAIRYAAGPIQLRLIRAQNLICEVSDGSSTSPYLRHSRTTDEGGRGLFLISQFTDHWGTRYTTRGKVIWAEQPLSGQDSGAVVRPVRPVREGA